MTTKGNLLAKELAKECRSVEEVQEHLKSLFKDTMQEIFEAEMDEHLGYDKHSPIGDHSGNSRNGYNKKTIKTKYGESTIEIPRDRNGDFEPQVIKKYQRTSNELEDKIISMYANGMTTRDIESHMQDIYGIEVSATMVSKVTDRILPMIAEWQSRPLDRIYPIVFLDAIHFKVREDNRIINKAAYSVLGINMAGHKEVLGIWIGGNESSKFWLGVLNDLKNRGVEDILIACKDGLSGFSEAINSAFPKTEIQLCVIHQIRNSMKYVSYKEMKQVMVDLKKVYQALTLDEAEYAFEEFKEKWGKKHPIIIKSWEKNWDELTVYFKYPNEIRKLIYTTNTIEAYHRQLRKVTKTKTSYPNDEALEKILYLATMEISKKWTQPLRIWKQCISQFAIYFEDRIDSNLAV
ncbi:IS256 family transposase [Alkalicella caledoniensis]|uniref:Mutator family transposase n=1 Tax=Alkalicella caledoniensis TaxID=2731377 RepID=A0A7G9W5X7_ALKCA|nr:IS256 family transposase [Alkalicella caledoniensis]QNO13285.1 IS256 family transposase [Alkalicella caledoniensis]QNO14072.1 IS256 family transposase [Alkalicella caledoniensis]QNO14089.1 IS256 family transposase [Alkalicella caledoniensis]QNO14094.1 IS256 family transposase [Alkalicella caledoniensis]QNO14318.1 IS256 family transposase [Alkalicella caledoniensis]